MARLDRLTRLFILLLLLVLILLGITLYMAPFKPAAPAASQDIPGAAASPTASSEVLFRTLPSPPVLTSTPFRSLPPTPTPHLQPSLRSLAEPHGVLVGASVAPGWLFDPDYSSLLRREFNLVTPENAMKWEYIHPEQERYDFDQADFIVDFARRNGLKVRGHTLVWTLQLPDWIEQGSFTRQEWIDLLRDHIHTVVGRYRGKPGDRTVIAWDVVNEAIKPDGSYLENIWYSNIGPEYIPLAFQFAHEADPQALLFYNDSEAEGMNQKSEAVYNLVKGLKEAGVPIDGVGLEMHITLDGQPTAEDLASNLRRLADLGLIVHITEMDVRIQDGPEVLFRQQSLPDRRKYSSALLAQAEVYRRVFTTCLQAPNCQAFVTWGLTDRQSWIPVWTGNPDAPLLFDEAGRPKPAYEALIEALKRLG